jgi:hypothetical protein
MEKIRSVSGLKATSFIDTAMIKKNRHLLEQRHILTKRGGRRAFNCTVTVN